MSLFSKTKDPAPPNGTATDTPTKLPNSGPVMLMRSLGLDPDAIIGQVQEAANTARSVTAHFDARLAAMEKQIEVMAGLLRSQSLLIQELCLVVSDLKVTTQPNETQPEVTSGKARVVAAGTIVED